MKHWLFKVCIALCAIGAFIWLFQQQEQKIMSATLSEKLNNVSQVPVDYTNVYGQSAEKQPEHATSSSSKESKQQENEEAQQDDQNQAQQTEKQDIHSTQLEKPSTATNEIKAEKKGDDEVASATTNGAPTVSQQRTQRGTGKTTQQQHKDIHEQSGAIEKDQAQTKEIVAAQEDDNPYFITSIQDGETVTKEKYSFSITQKQPDKEVQEIIVTVNDIPQSYDGAVTLAQGENKIHIQVTYDKDETVNRQYTVYYEQNKLVIHTNIEDGSKTNTKTITFQANASFNEQIVPVTTYLNGESLVEKDTGTYEAVLAEGANDIQITAEKDGEQVEKTVRIIYEKKQSTINIETDLTNQQVSSAELFFYATASSGGQTVPLVATLNDEVLEATNDTYFDLLKPGKNTVVLSAKVDDDEERETYTVYYQEPSEASGGTVKDDAHGPTIVTDLTNGAQVRGTIKNIMIWAKDASGQTLPASGVAVSVNGKTGQMIWADSEKISYRLKLSEGKNNVVIKAWDNEGRITTKTYTAYAKNIDEGKDIGTATISVEATTVGLGYLIKPTKVTIHEGEKASYVFDQLLRDKGYSYINSGTLDHDFYLAHILKDHLTANVHIPEDLAKLVKKHALYFDETRYSENKLGEFNFSNGSGWMYSINGDYPNYGLSDAYLLDGDVVRVRYTLFYGNDIGGGVPGSNEGDNKNDWNKEW